MIRIDSDAPRGVLTRIELDVYGAAGNSPVRRFHGVYDLIGGDAYSTPGDVGIVARDQNDSSRLRIEVAGTLRSGGPPLRRTAVVSFRPNRVLYLDMFLALGCQAVECGADLTCGRLGCETIFRSPEEFRPDASYDSGPLDVTIADASYDETATPDGCVPACFGRTCGDDGCGGSCGTCAAGRDCVDGVCQCRPDCTGRRCGPDPVCGQLCGECPTDTPNCIRGVCCGGIVSCP